MDAEPVAVLGPGLDGSFGPAHFGGCELGDRRLVRRAVVSADAFWRHPGGTLPHKLSRPELSGFYDLANNSRVNHENLLEAHRRRPRKRVRRWSTAAAWCW